MEKSKEGTSLLTIKISILYLIANLKNFAIKSYCIFYFYIVKLLNIEIYRELSSFSTEILENIEAAGILFCPWRCNVCNCSES